MTDTKTSLKFHPEAANSFRQRGNRLLSALKPVREEAYSQRFRAERHATGTLTQEDLSGPPLHQTVDSLTMEVTAITFCKGKEQIGISGRDCREVDALAEAIQKTRAFKSRISIDFTRNEILSWLQERSELETDRDLPAYLVAKATAALHTVEVWVPLANLAVEVEVHLNPVRVRSLTKARLEEWLTKLSDRKSASNRGFEEGAERFREQIQGLAASTIAVRAEGQFAVDKALEKAEEVAAFFRLLHPANSHPRAAFYCRPIGRENVESYTALLVKHGSLQGRRANMLPPYPSIWNLDEDRLLQLERYLKPIRKLISPTGHSEFSKDVLEAILLYTRSTMLREPDDKLLFIFSSLEAVLLKDRGEPIQSSIADRLAFLLGGSVEERKTINRLTRKVYDYRSELVHHGRMYLDLEKLEELRIFMRYVWVFFLRLPRLSEKYAKRAEFFEAIETKKYSVP